MIKPFAYEQPDKTEQFMNWVVAETIKAVIFTALGYAWAFHHINL